MMAETEICKVCNKKVLRHSYKIRCSSCKHLVHMKCLPNVKNDDPLYTSYVNNVWYCSICISNILPFNHLSDEDFISSLAELREAM